MDSDLELQRMDPEFEKKYFKLLLEFHKNRIQVVSQGSTKCKGCENDKIISQSNNLLTLNCGEGSTKCGVQFSIQLPQYQHYDIYSKLLKDKIDGQNHYYTNDIDDLSVYNLEALKKYLDIDDQYNEQKEMKNEAGNILTIIKDFYSKNNNMSDIEKNIKELSIIKHKINNDKQKIMKQLLSERETDKKIILRKRYAELAREEKINIYPLIEGLNNKNLKYLMMKHPIINEYSDNYKEKIKTKKTKKKKQNDEDQLIEIILDFFKKNNGEMTKSEYKEIKGNYKTEWGERLFSSLRFSPEDHDKDIHPWKKKEQKKYGPIIEEPLNDKIRLTQKWIQFLIEEEDEQTDEILNEGYELCKRLAHDKLSIEDINQRRDIIRQKLIKEIGEDISHEDIKKINANHLLLMFQLYDKHFFDDELQKLSTTTGCKWVICWNDRCTSTAGRVHPACKEGECEIIKLELATKVFKKALKKFSESEDSFIKLDKENKCDSILSCLTFIFEHELIHALQVCFCQKWMRSNKGPHNWDQKTAPSSGHSKTFMTILNNKFGHLTFKHSLLLNNDEYKKQFGD